MIGNGNNPPLLSQIYGVEGCPCNNGSPRSMEGVVGNVVAGVGQDRPDHNWFRSIKFGSQLNGKGIRKWYRISVHMWMEDRDPHINMLRQSNI